MSEGYCFCNNPNDKKSDVYCRECGNKIPTENWCSDENCDGECNVPDKFCNKCGKATMLYEEQKCFVQY